MIIGHRILASKAIPYLEGLPCDALFFVIDRATLGALPEEMSVFIDRYPSLLLDIRSDQKDLSLLTRIWEWLQECRASRASVLVAIGGGTMSDVVGFAAASYMRGIRFVNISTSLLSMVDASVGGKTGIDFAGVKNLVGAFHQPLEVIIDTCFLDTLDISELYSGYGEIIKTALLAGETTWRQLLALGDPQYFRESEWLELVEMCVAYKSAIVEQDPEERTGLRAVLNLGHTVGHALEAFSRETGAKRGLLHGEAVVIGLIVESYLACKYMGLDKKVLRQLMGYVRELYPYYIYTCRDYPRILQLMRSDKKNESEGITFVLLKSLGVAERWVAQDEEEVREALDFYREGFGG